MARITYTDKESYSTDQSIDDKYKCTSGDMNSIKNAVNDNGKYITATKITGYNNRFQMTIEGTLQRYDIFHVYIPSNNDTQIAYLKVNDGDLWAIANEYGTLIKANAISNRYITLVYTGYQGGNAFRYLPTPYKTSDLVNDSGFITNTVDNLTNYTKSSDLSDVATSGSYDDLDDKPDLSIYELISNKTTSLTSSSTDTQYPSAKCVYDYIDTIVGDINTALDTINGEII